MFKKKLILLIVLQILFGLNLYGCGSRRDEYMLQKSKQRRMIFDSQQEQKDISYMEGFWLEPESLYLTKKDIELYIEYFDEDKLEDFFEDEERFGDRAGPNPYFQDLVVFYIRITNNSDSVIRIDPKRFVILDDNHSQYLYVDSDYIISLYRTRSSIYSVTQSTGRYAPGGLYGAPVDVATRLAGRGIDRKLVQIKSVELTGGFIHRGVIYDGFIAFFKPTQYVEEIILFLPNIKTRFDVRDEPIEEIEFSIPFKVKTSKINK